MGLGSLITQVIAGRAVAERSQRRQLEKKYAQAAKELQFVTEVSPEQPITTSSASSYRSNSSYLEPFQPKHPQQPLARSSRPPLERSQSELCTQKAKTRGPHITYTTPDVTTQDSSAGQITRNKSCNNFWDSHSLGPLPPMPELRGVGRHRLAVDADEEHQMEHLKRTMSDITDQMVNDLGDFEYSGTDQEVWRRYQKSRTASMTSSTSSHSSGRPIFFPEVLDAKRNVNVVRGFTPSFISSSSGSAADDGSSHYLKDSVLSITNISGDGEIRNRRRKSRQSSIPISDSSAASPLTTITENPDALDKPRAKVEQLCALDLINNDSALASDASDDEDAWLTELNAAPQTSQLTKQISRERTMSDENHQSTKPRTRSSDNRKPRQPTKPAIDRSRTVKHVVRPTVRQVHPHHRNKSKPLAVNKPQVDVTLQQEDVVSPEVEREVVDPTFTSKASQCTLDKSGESKENPSDLNHFMEKIRTQHSSKTQRKKTRESEDDSASINSDSTTKTVVPLVAKLAGALSIHRRQRSATAFRAPPTNCQPADKAEGIEAIACKETAH